MTTRISYAARVRGGRIGAVNGPGAALTAPGLADTWMRGIDMAEPMWAARFWAKVDRSGPVPTYAPELGPCWLWRASVSPEGYGQFWLEGRYRGAHRVSLSLTGWDIASKYPLDHLCRVRACVNRAHLEQVTDAENNRRAAAAKTHCINGHPYVDIVIRSGVRVCRICEVEGRRRRSGWKGNLPTGERTHCPSGHEYTPENTRVYQGRRYCEECRRIRQRRRP